MIEADDRLAVIHNRLTQWGNEIIKTQIIAPLKDMNNSPQHMNRFNRFLSDSGYQTSVLVQVAKSKGKNKLELFESLIYEE